MKDDFMIYHARWRDDPTPFPDKCPGCGAKKIIMAKNVDYQDYVCGGGWRQLVQIQTHTEKWFAKCGEVPAGKRIFGPKEHANDSQ